MATDTSIHGAVPVASESKASDKSDKSDKKDNRLFRLGDDIFFVDRTANRVFIQYSDESERIEELTILRDMAVVDMKSVNSRDMAITIVTEEHELYLLQWANSPSVSVLYKLDTGVRDVAVVRDNDDLAEDHGIYQLIVLVVGLDESVSQRVYRCDQETGEVTWNPLVLERKGTSLRVSLEPTPFIDPTVFKDKIRKVTIVASEILSSLRIVITDILVITDSGSVYKIPVVDEDFGLRSSEGTPVQIQFVDRSQPKDKILDNVSAVDLRVEESIERDVLGEGSFWESPDSLISLSILDNEGRVYHTCDATAKKGDPIKVIHVPWDGKGVKRMADSELFLTEDGNMVVPRCWAEGANLLQRVNGAVDVCKGVGETGFVTFDNDANVTMVASVVRAGGSRRTFNLYDEYRRQRTDRLRRQLNGEDPDAEEKMTQLFDALELDLLSPADEHIYADLVDKARPHPVLSPEHSETARQLYERLKSRLAG